MPPLATGRVPVGADTDTVPHAGGVLGPVDRMAWPAVEPAGFSSWTGLSVAALATVAIKMPMAASSRFMVVLI